MAGTSARRPALAGGPGARFVERFQKLASAWRAETGGFSSPSRKTGHQTYLDVVGMGPDVIPLILADLRDTGGYWYPALRSLTLANPVLAEHRGDAILMTADWLRWARGEGYEV